MSFCLHNFLVYLKALGVATHMENLEK